MKAILVFEVDEDVFKELEKTSDLDIRFKYHDTMYVSKEKRIINYSLKPMPEKVETPKIIQEQIDGWYKLAGEYIGYNACIEEILGETDKEEEQECPCEFESDYACANCSELLGEE